MKMLKARVEKGRLKLDVPTDRPEGEVVDLIAADEIDDLAGMDPADRAGLEESLRISDEEIARGDTISAEESIRRVRERDE